MDDYKSTIEDVIARNWKYPFWGYRLYMDGVYGKLLELGVIREDAFVQAYNKGMVDVDTRVPDEDLEILSKGELGLKKILDYMKNARFGLSGLIKAREHNIQLGPLENAVEQDKMIPTAPPIDIEKEIQAAGASSGLRKMLAKKGGRASRLQARLRQRQTDYLCIHKEEFNQELEDGSTKRRQTFLFVPRNVVEWALANGYNPADVKMMYEGEEQNIFLFAVKDEDGTQILKPDISPKGLLIDMDKEGNYGNRISGHERIVEPDGAENINKRYRLGTGGFAEVWRRALVSGERVRETKDGRSLSREPFIAEKVPKPGEMARQAEFIIEMFKREGEFYKFLEDMPHIANAQLLDLSAFKVKQKVKLLSEILYGEVTDFVRDRTMELLKYLPKTQASVDQAFSDACTMGFEHMLRALVSLRLAKTFHGDWKDENILTSMRYHDHSFTRPIRRLNFRGRTFTTDPKEINAEYWALMQDLPVHHDSYLVIADCGASRHEFEENDSRINHNPVCTPQYLDPWFFFTHRAYPNYDTDMFAAGVSLEDVVRRYVDKRLFNSRTESHPMCGIFREEWKEIHSMHAQHISNPNIGPEEFNIVSAFMYFDSIARNHDEMTLQVGETEDSHEMDCPEITGIEKDYLVDFVFPPMIAVLDYHKRFTTLLREMCEMELLHLEMGVIEIIESCTAPPGRRASLAPDAQGEQLTPLYAIKNLRHRYL